MNFVIDPEDIKPWQIHKGVLAKVVADGQKMTALMTVWEPGSSFLPHAHPHEQIGICIKGEAIFSIDGKDYVVKEGYVYHIPSDVVHSERNEGQGQAVFVECFAPVRKDLLQKRFEQKTFPKEGD